MKKIIFILLSTFTIAFLMASSAFAINVKNAATAISSTKGAAGAANVPAPQVKPVPAATAVPAQSQVKPVPASTTVPVQDKTQPVSAANATIAPTADAYNYNPVGKTDPFRPFIVVEVVEKKIEKKEPLSIFPLQRAETDRYRVVGIAGDEDHRVAIAEDTAKKFYPLLKGTRIGLRNGKVVEIMADRVIVEEYEGNKAKRVILKLRKN
jgi:type IV pilus assembly protein PilP